MNSSKIIKNMFEIKVSINLFLQNYVLHKLKDDGRIHKPQFKSNDNKFTTYSS